MNLKQIIRKWSFLLVAVFSTFLFTTACGDTTNINEQIITQEDERAMGVDFDRQIRSADGGGMMTAAGEIFVAENAAEEALEDYVDSLGHLLVEQIEPKYVEDLLPANFNGDIHDFFSFTLIRDTIVNAFAVPGGFVYLYTDILKVFESEAELAGVLAHEIAHVVKHHSRDQMLKSFAASELLGALFGDGGLTSDMLQTLAMAKANSEFSQADEFEADEIGTKYTAMAGISPYGIRDFFGRGLIDENGNCNDEGGFDETLQRYLGTHPPDCERVEAVEEQIAVMDASVRNQPRNQERYQQIVSDALGFSF